MPTAQANEVIKIDGFTESYVEEAATERLIIDGRDNEAVEEELDSFPN